MPDKASKNLDSIKGVIYRNNFENKMNLSKRKPEVNVCVFSSGNRSSKKDTWQSGLKIFL